jgi:hypothetical protein
VSRRSFRVDVAEPRPASAWALVIVASATLWITQQLAPWVVAVQVTFLLYSLAVSSRPRPWQQNPIVLNAGMFFIVAVTIRVAFQGGPSTIALAHFAALTQTLQLIDARPRRTESSPFSRWSSRRTSPTVSSSRRCSWPSCSRRCGR